MQRVLIVLAAATFAVGTDGFVVAGVLPQVADDLRVPAPTAGQLVTAYTLTYAVTSERAPPARRRPAQAPLLNGLNSSVVHLGASAAGVLGAMVLRAVGPYGLGPFAAVLVLAGLGFAELAHRAIHRRRLAGIQPPRGTR